jgi:hypothetical protein
MKKAHFDFSYIFSGLTELCETLLKLVSQVIGIGSMEVGLWLSLRIG